MFALFADAPSPIETWIGPIAASALSFGTAFLAYLGTRDKLRYDLRMATLEGEVQRLTDENTKLDSQHANCEQKHDELRGELSAVKARLDLLSEIRGKP